MSGEKVEVYSEGECLGNPGSGAWAFKVRYLNGEERLGSGVESNVTSNKMEIVAIFEALKSVEGKCDLVLHVGSQYVAKTINVWLGKWSGKSWMKTDGKSVKHKEYWMSIERILKQHSSVQCFWIKNRVGHKDNLEVVRIARTLLNKQEDESASLSESNQVLMEKGDKVGQLELRERFEKPAKNGDKLVGYWVCQCSCGNSVSYSESSLLLPTALSYHPYLPYP